MRPPPLHPPRYPRLGNSRPLTFLCQETFLVFDLEALSISTTNILLAPAIAAGPPASNHDVILHKAYSIFDELVAGGNRIAGLMRSELQQLGQLLAAASSGGSPSQDGRPVSGETDGTAQPLGCAGAPSAIHTAQPPPAQPALGELVEPLPGFVFGADGFGGVLSSEQIMDLANAIDMDQAEWMLQATRSPEM